MTISMPKALNDQVTRVARRLHVSRSEYVRQAIQDKLWGDAVEATRRELVPRAREQGIYTDEDVFRLIS